MNLLEIKAKGEVVFVGDTHGDLEASQKIIRKYLEEESTICFLGDYVDRGPQSNENIEFLLEQRDQHPTQIYLLKGNHENFMEEDFYPADFWNKLSKRNKQKYAKLFKPLSLAISVGDILALHGAIPDLQELQEINKLEKGDKDLHTILWGDMVKDKNANGEGTYSKFRPQYGEKHFLRVMNKIGKSILIRSHDPTANLSMYKGRRCITLMTSSAYKTKRRIAIADFDKGPVRNRKDLTIKEI